MRGRKNVASPPSAISQGVYEEAMSLFLGIWFEYVKMCFEDVQERYVCEDVRM